MAKPQLLASLTDLQAELPLVRAATLETALRRAGDAFIGAVGWPVLLHDGQVVAHGDGGRTLFLPVRHVHSASVAICGAEPQLAGGFGSEIRLDGRLGMLVRDGGWPRGLANIVVEYSAGWKPSEIPGDISDAVTERAMWLASSPMGASQITAGPFSATLGGAGAGATQAWSDTVARYAVGVGDRA